MRQVKTKKKGISLKAKIIIGIIVFIMVAFAVFLTSPVGKQTLKKADEVWQNICQKSDLELKQVLIHGHQRTTKDEVMRALNLRQGMPIMDVDLQNVRTRVMELPWVKDAAVQRYLPSTIFIELHEKTPIAVWQNKKKYFPLDNRGHIILDNTKKLSNLILVVGTDARSKTPALIDMLEKFPTLYPFVKSAVRVGERRWNLVFHAAEDGLVVYLPETNPEMALKRLEKLQKADNILEKDLKVIDLRLEDRLIVRTANASDSKRKGKK